MRTFFRLLAAAVIAAAISMASYLAGFVTQRATSPARQPTTAVESLSESQRSFQVFWEAWGILQQEFYGPVPGPEEMTQSAIRGLVRELDDPYTAYLTPRQAKLLNDDLNGSFEGIGATIEMRDGRLVIVSTLEGYPAQRAGLLPGDVVVAVDGKSLEGLDAIEAAVLIRGPSGTTVRLTVLREGEPEPLEISVVRARIQIVAVEGQMLDEGIAYVKISHFTSGTSSDLRSTLRALRRQQPSGLILDLRGNPGGLLPEAVGVASEFIGDGVILTERRQDGSEQVHHATAGGLATDLPLVVLVNAGTASAAEIVAGAIQDHGRGTLVGETTFGKGSVQLHHSLSDGSSLRVTIAHWSTPNGRQINKQGLKPDVTVEQDDGEGDVQLERSIEILESHLPWLRKPSLPTARRGTTTS